MRKFTATEIDLCKKIAEKKRRFPKKGDYEYNDVSKEITLRTSEYLGNELPVEANIFPLWQEHDCLEWLNEKAEMRCWDLFRGESLDDVVDPMIENFHRFECQYIRYIDKSEKGDYEQPVIDTTEAMGKTPLEALLRAVLAVMEE